jgi:hypothetical protein
MSLCGGVVALLELACWLFVPRQVRAAGAGRQAGRQAEARRCGASEPPLTVWEPLLTVWEPLLTVWEPPLTVWEPLLWPLLTLVCSLLH